jgi:hypothetical protein
MPASTWDAEALAAKAMPEQRGSPRGLPIRVRIERHEVEMTNEKRQQPASNTDPEHVHIADDHWHQILSTTDFGIAVCEMK